MSKSGKILLWGFAAIVASIAIAHQANKASGPLPTTKPTPTRYLDSRSGAELERTVRRVIDSAGYSCDSIRSVRRMDPGDIARLGIEDGRWVDCSADGVFGVLESPEGFRAVKR